jgi:hypothetical protein
VAPHPECRDDYENYLSKCFENGEFVDKKPGMSHNIISIGLVVEYNGFKILLCSDMENRSWTRFVDVYGEDIRPDIIKVAHHGSRNGFHDGFWESFSPKKPISVITCFCSQGLPEKNVLSKIRKYSSKTYVLSEEGYFSVSKKYFDKEINLEDRIAFELDDFTSVTKKSTRKQSFGSCSFSIDSKGEIKKHTQIGAKIFD